MYGQQNIKSSLPYSRKPVTGPYTEKMKRNSHPHNNEDQFWYYPIIYIEVSQVALSILLWN